MKNVYDVDLCVKMPVVKIISPEVLARGLKLFNTKDPRKLTTPDRLIFKTEFEADLFLDDYNRNLEILKEGKTCQDRKLPALICKRRYIVQALMSEKNMTTRGYKKDWKKGQLFNLHDQTYFLTVKLKNIKKSGDNYQYNYELV